MNLLSYKCFFIAWTVELEGYVFICSDGKFTPSASEGKPGDNIYREAKGKRRFIPHIRNREAVSTINILIGQSRTYQGSVPEQELMNERKSCSSFQEERTDSLT